VLQGEVFVGKFSAVDALTSGAVFPCEVSLNIKVRNGSVRIADCRCDTRFSRRGATSTYTLAHEARNDSMERRSLEMQILSRTPNTLFSCAEASKVLRDKWEW